MDCLFYKYGSNAFVIFILLIFTGCASDPLSERPKLVTEGTFSQAGLEEVWVNSFSVFEGQLYAATDSGLYRSPLAGGGSTWNPLGLQEENVIDVVFLPGQKLYAAIRISNNSDSIPSLFLSADDGQSWQPHMGNYGGETGEYTRVSALDAPGKPSDTVFARVGGGSTVVLTTNGGDHWNLVLGQWNYIGGAALLVKADPYHKGRVWAGGVNAFSQPYLLQSTDDGNSWKGLNILENTEAVCYDVASHPNRKKHLLAGLGGSIRKSTNNGKSWNNVLTGIGILTFAHSAANPNIVYAAGGTFEGTLSFVGSADFGDSWETVELEDGPTEFRVNDMVSVLQDGQEVLYLGTNKGVYSFTFEE